MSGRLIYVMGPSGAGKDTLLAGLRATLPAGAAVTFAHRYITRPADAGGENHVALSAAEFALRLERGLFALHWDSHGLRYGIGREIDLWMAAGLTVVVNGSRGAMDEALLAYPDMRPVAITADPAVLRARLEARGRETAAEIAERLARAAAFPLDHPAIARVDNSGAVADAVARLRVVVLEGLEHADGPV
ncbi:phosphonate metabolism protein/1,5-bisphosphokinase (PRPP-forming) PhnN [Novispirillum sp. DQ9]|uniref:phosphonate metabolism protein/1,5-bisphosphokinase (PRPP-forming) PhnN n=1 Tax=Novispirillum sp. DQ9 TaxID=3398612 RepID=UPI003C7BE67B